MVIFLWQLRPRHCISLEISLSIMWVMTLSYVCWSRSKHEIQPLFYPIHLYIHTYTHSCQVSKYVAILKKVWENKRALLHSIWKLKIEYLTFLFYNISSTFNFKCLCHLPFLVSYLSQEPSKFLWAVSPI